MHKILIVDDEPNILLSLDFLMKKNGYSVFLARNGEEALASIEQNMPDLIILDIMMPDIDGYEICRIVRSNPQFAKIKIMFLSAKSKESDVSRGIKTGADDYLTKPFVNKELIKRVQNLVSP